MNAPFTSWVDLTLYQAQRCHHLAWFLYGWLEREHVLNVNAAIAGWVRGDTLKLEPPLVAAEVLSVRFQREDSGEKDM
jgi:hypothetical protein